MDMPGSTWMPLVAVLFFALGYGFGVGPIPWILLGELLPTPIRVVGAAICIFLYAALQVVVGLSFPPLLQEVGLGGSLLFFAAFNVVMTVVVHRFLPETALSSLHYLEDAFKVDKRTDSSEQQDRVVTSSDPLLGS